jgi:hypothetical protein
MAWTPAWFCTARTTARSGEPCSKFNLKLPLKLHKFRLKLTLKFHTRCMPGSSQCGKATNCAPHPHRSALLHVVWWWQLALVMRMPLCTALLFQGHDIGNSTGAVGHGVASVWDHVHHRNVRHWRRYAVCCTAPCTTCSEWFERAFHVLVADNESGLSWHSR